VRKRQSAVAKAVHKLKQFLEQKTVQTKSQDKDKDKDCSNSNTVERFEITLLSIPNPNANSIMCCLRNHRIMVQISILFTLLLLFVLTCIKVYF
jgi:hypothetical protein